MTRLDTDLLTLFNVLHVEPDQIEDHIQIASVMDIATMAYEFRYALTPELLQALDALTGEQRATVFLRLRASFNESVKGMADNVGAMYRAFPHHTVDPATECMCLWMLHVMGFEIRADPRSYGADPMTGFQNDHFGPNADYDDVFTLRFVAEGGNKRRKMRWIKLADDKFVESKMIAMMNNLTPFTPAELRFVKVVLEETPFDAKTFASLKFREKLPLIADALPTPAYVAACNSVTDVLRLAVHMSGPQHATKLGSSHTTFLMRGVSTEPDLSLQTNTRFKLTTSQSNRVMAVLEGILDRGNTDYATDFNRHGEAWKRLARTIRSDKYEKRHPNTVTALKALRFGELHSWQSTYENSDVFTKIEMARARPGTFVRNVVALNRAVRDGNGKGKRHLVSAAREAFPKATIPALLQLNTHLDGAVYEQKRFHSLPNGTLMMSEREVEDIVPMVKTVLHEVLAERLAGTLPFSVEVPMELDGMFVPSANRSASDADTRTARGDRIKLDYEDNDVVRFFLHWHEACDVDLSAVFFDEGLNHMGECTYYNTRNKWYSHSGDILDGRNGAAEYIDIKIGDAKEAGVRYILQSANVYSGQTFDTFQCHVGLMIRDGQTGSHFEVSTVETKLSLDSPTRWTQPALLDLETGEMIFVDIKTRADNHSNVATKLGSLKDQMQYMVNFCRYKPTFGDIIRLGGSTEPDAPVATVQAVRDMQDELLATIADL